MAAGEDCGDGRFKLAFSVQLLVVTSGGVAGVESDFLLIRFLLVLLLAAALVFSKTTIGIINALTNTGSLIYLRPFLLSLYPPLILKPPLLLLNHPLTPLSPPSPRLLLTSLHYTTVTTGAFVRIAPSTSTHLIRRQTRRYWTMAIQIRRNHIRSGSYPAPMWF